MNKMTKIMLVFLFSFISACGQQKESVFIEKDGTLYEISDQVSFYYPKTFEVDIRDDNSEVLQFFRGEEVIKYTKVKDTTDNKVEELPALYEGQLVQLGVKDLSYSKVVLDSGNECYVYSGYYEATGIRFKHIVYFSMNASFIYSYEAPKTTYEENVDIITRYLESLIVHYDSASKLDSVREI